MVPLDKLCEALLLRGRWSQKDPSLRVQAIPYKSVSPYPALPPQSWTQAAMTLVVGQRRSSARAGLQQFHLSIPSDISGISLAAVFWRGGVSLHRKAAEVVQKYGGLRGVNASERTGQTQHRSSISWLGRGTGSGLKNFMEGTLFFSAFFWSLRQLHPAWSHVLGTQPTQTPLFVWVGLSQPEQSCRRSKGVQQPLDSKPTLPGCSSSVSQLLL